MMRCSVCNGYGYNVLNAKEAAARGDCPTRVLAVVDEFFACKTCGKLYWQGPKSNDSMRHFKGLFESFAQVAVVDG